MPDYPDIEIDKESGRVISHNEDGSYHITTSVEAIIFAKMLFELEKIAMSLKSLDDKTR